MRDDGVLNRLRRHFLGLIAHQTHAERLGGVRKARAPQHIELWGPALLARKRQRLAPMCKHLGKPKLRATHCHVLKTRVHNHAQRIHDCRFVTVVLERTQQEPLNQFFLPRLIARRNMLRLTC